MKTVKLLALLVVAGALIFSGCKKDDEAADVPTISVSLKTGYDLTAWKGDTIKWTVTMGTNEKLATLKVEPNVGNTGTNVVNQTLSGTSQVVDYFYIVPTAGINDGDQIVITFTVTNDKDGTANATQTLTMDAPAVGAAITTYTGKTLGGASHASIGSYFNCASGNIMLQAAADAAQGSVDLVFTYSGTNGNLMSAPNDATIDAAFSNITAWTTKNATKFTAVLTGITWANVTDDLPITTAVTTSTASNTRINSLAPAGGDIFGFITAAGKKGLIQVTATAGTTGADRTITFNVKIQQ